LLIDNHLEFKKEKGGEFVIVFIISLS